MDIKHCGANATPSYLALFSFLRVCQAHDRILGLFLSFSNNFIMKPFAPGVFPRVKSQLQNIPLSSTEDCRLLSMLPDFFP